MTAAASPYLPSTLSSQGNPADWGQRRAPLCSARLPPSPTPSLCPPCCLWAASPNHPSPGYLGPRVHPCIPPLSPLTGCWWGKVDTKRCFGSWSWLCSWSSKPGIYGGDGGLGATGILLPASICHLLSQANPINPTLPGAEVAACSPVEVFKGQVRSSAALSL